MHMLLNEKLRLNVNRLCLYFKFVRGGDIRAKMFAAYRNCTKIVRLSEILGSSFIRPFSVKSKLNINNALSQNLSKNCLRKEFSSAVESSNAEHEEKEINFDAITNGDKNLEHKLKVLLLEAEVMRQEGKPVPQSSFINQEQWKELLNLPTRTARRKYFEFIFKISKKKEHREVKKLEKRVQLEQYKAAKESEEKCEESIEEFALKYDLQHNNMFLRIYDTTINHMYNNRLIQAIMFGQKLVIDCGYDVNMTKRENLNCAKQIMLLFAENRMHDDPFDLHICNADLEGLLIPQLEKHIPNMFETAFPLNIHQSSYLDLFPKDQLVYLTPHCREEISEYDHDAIYIVGAIVDKINNQPLSLAKAKREGLKMAKFPLDKYLEWGAGSGKNLTLNQVVSILNDVKLTGNWEYALRHVPKRKLTDFNVGSNITKATDNVRYDKPRRERKWTPSANVNFGNLSYNNNDKRKERERMVQIKNIIND